MKMESGRVIKERHVKCLIDKIIRLKNAEHTEGERRLGAEQQHKEQVVNHSFQKWLFMLSSVRRKMEKGITVTDGAEKKSLTLFLHWFEQKSSRTKTSWYLTGAHNTKGHEALIHESVVDVLFSLHSSSALVTVRLSNKVKDAAPIHS